MTAPWTLLIVIVSSGVFSGDAKLHNIPMNNDLACKAAALKLAEKSKSVGFICINSITGETFEVKP